MLKKSLVVLVILFIAGLLVFQAPGNTDVVYAEEKPTPGPNRISTINVNTVLFNWWLVYWSDNSVACSFAIEHEGKPNADEVIKGCGDPIYKKWTTTKPCVGGETGLKLQACSGMYLHNIGTQNVWRKVKVELPLPQVWISIAGCTFDAGQNKCVGIPSLRFSGEEKLPNETITGIEGQIGGTPFSCNGSDCTIPLAPTSEKGVSMTFWGNSSYGDTTIVYDAMVRVVPWGDFMSPDTQSSDIPVYYIDVLSSQWKGGQSPACAAIWQVFPEIKGPPDWLDTPATSSGLKSTLSLYYLAAKLIQNGTVNAQSCPSGGLDSSIAANQCGLETAMSAATNWQNQFDEQIYKAAVDSGIPGQLLKNIFIRESQLWPGVYFDAGEVGFGQLTENGADTVLLWNPGFFNQFCPLVLSQGACDLGYSQLNDSQQSMLRGALVKKVNASCQDCALGIDLSQANFSIKVFAETLVGNCNQVNRIIYNITRQSAGKLSSYNDLWRFTLTNYNAGPGCLYTAVNRTWDALDPIDWEHVAANLEPACRGAVNYVEDVSKGDSAEIPVYSTLLPTNTTTPVRSTSTPTLTPTPTVTLTPTITPTPTHTLTP